MKLDWNSDQLLLAVDAALDDACKDAADDAANTMRRLVSKDSGELANAIDARRSEFARGGYVIGIFGTPTTRWEDSLGGRAWFLEYGHAFPGEGQFSAAKKLGVGRSKVRRQNLAAKSVAPKPFMRPALRRLRRTANKHFTNRLKGLAA